MGCGCQNKTAEGKAKTYVVTAKDGKQIAYKTDTEAAAAARRLQGSYRAA